VRIKRLDVEPPVTGAPADAGAGVKAELARLELVPRLIDRTVERAVEDGSAQVGELIRGKTREPVQQAPVDPRERAIRDQFAAQFGALAKDAEKFHALMKQVYGEGYDRAKAEAFRESALNGDYSWLPKIRFVGADTLGGANGAYDQASGTVILNQELDPSTMAQTFVEEAGHHLDAQLNKVDTRGDEGEMFRRLLGGERLSATEMRAINNENDKGVITVDGKKIEVEFWNPIKAVVGAVKGAAKAVGGAVKDTVKGVVKGVVSVAEGVVKGISSFFKGLFHGITGFFSNLVHGRVQDAFKALWKGVDEALLKSTGQILNGAMTGVEDVAMGAASLLGPLKNPVKAVLRRGFDAARSLIMGTWDALRGAANNIAEGTGQFLRGFGKLFVLDFKGAFKDMGMGALKVAVQTPIDAAIMIGGKHVSAIQTLVGLEKAGRKLTDAEIAVLKKVYGDTIDYDQVRIKEGFAGVWSLNDRPFAHGNTIYMKDNTITDALLVHEMAHVWQHQNGGTDFMSEALMSQWWGNGYDWEKSVPGTKWAELEPEQQAKFLEAAFESGFFDGPGRTFVHNGVDYTDYLKDALKQVRAGQGAP
jgi:hypothetical protein